MTEKARRIQLLDSGLSTKSSIKANPYTIQMKCYGEGFSEPNSSDAKLPRKVSRVNCIGACTENQHRWARRVS